MDGAKISQARNLVKVVAVGDQQEVNNPAVGDQQEVNSLVEAVKAKVNKVVADRTKKAQGSRLK